jgi:hypothetical protein
MISGKPVNSSIERTSSPAAVSSRAVPPVETSSTPSAARPCAKSTIPRLSETDSSALRTRTSPGAIAAPSRPLLDALSVGDEIVRGYRSRWSA